MTDQADIVRTDPTDVGPDTEPGPRPCASATAKPTWWPRFSGCSPHWEPWCSSRHCCGRRANVELQTNLLNQDGTLDDVEIVGAIAAMVVLFVSFLVGGIAAGRMSRYDGGMNGLGTALWFLLLVTVFAALGAWVGEEYNAFALADLPNWVAQVDVEEVTTAAIVMSMVATVVTLLGGYPRRAHR